MIIHRLCLKFLHLNSQPHIPGDNELHVLLPVRVRYRVSFAISNSESFTINTLGLRQNGRHFADNILRCIFVNKNVSISVKISLKFVPKHPINNIPALVQIMAWRQSGNKPLSELMMVIFLVHICVTQPHGVNSLWPKSMLIFWGIHLRTENNFTRSPNGPCYMCPDIILLKSWHNFPGSNGLMLRIFANP